MKINPLLIDGYTKVEIETLLLTKQPLIDSTHKLSADLVDDTNQNNKFVSATEKSNISKSLYHLGAFDSVSGNTITRKTGYVDLGSLNWTLYQGDGFWYWYNTTFKRGQYYTADTVVDCKHAIYRAVRYNNADFDVDNRVGYNNETIVVRTSSTTKRPSGILQYKLATSYTEDIIPNQPILNLDSNMANKIRQKVVDGLNLLPPSCYHEGNNIEVNGTLGTYGGGTYSCYYLVPVKPNTTYCASSNGNVIKSTSLGVATYDINGNFIAYVEWTASVGTTASNVYFISFDFYTTSTNIMLNEGTHSYPYSDFNQKEHITNDEAILLKQEEEKCRNLFNINNNVVGDTNQKHSISGSTITITSSSGSNCYSSFKENPFKPNTTYTLSWGSVTNTGNAILQIGIYDGEDIVLPTQVNSNGSITFTTRANATTLNVAFYTKWIDNLGGYGTSTINDVMLVEKTIKYPYQDWNGDIVHKKDIEPVLLWKNGSPNSSFNPDSGQDYAEITVKDRTPYKYIKVFVSLGAGNNIFQIITLENITNGYETQLFMIDDNATCWTRSFKFVDNTTIRIGKGKNGSSAVNNNRVVPKAIYGAYNL